MGKAKQFKRFRREAETMTAIVINRHDREVITGSELIMRGTGEVGGKFVDPMKNYSVYKAVQVPLNHTRQMKKIYNKDGHAGVRTYQTQVARFATA